jgi:hypothetical protein
MVVISADLSIHRETVFKLPKGGICVISGLHLPREKCKGKHLAVVARADVLLPEITQVPMKPTSHKCSGI